MILKFTSKKIQKQRLLTEPETTENPFEEENKNLKKENKKLSFENDKLKFENEVLRSEVDYMKKHVDEVLGKMRQCECNVGYRK